MPTGKIIAAVVDQVDNLHDKAFFVILEPSVSPGFINREFMFYVTGDTVQESPPHKYLTTLIVPSYPKGIHLCEFLP